jgi:predicted NBD/HSP70 family sugar kinase
MLSEKEKRNLAILDLIRKKGPIARSDISKATGINAVSISNYMKNYLEKGLVVEREIGASSGGRKPELAQLNTDENYVIGLALVRKSISGVVMDIGLNISQRLSVTLEGQAGKDPAGPALDLIDDLLKKSKFKPKDIKYIGIASELKDMTSLSDETKKKFSTSVCSGSAALAAALYEKNFNREADVESVLYVYSDLGHCVIMKGETLLDAEAYLKPWPGHISMAELAKREVARGVGTAIVDAAGGDLNGIDMDSVMKAAAGKDEVALDIMKSVAMNLGVRIAYLVNLYSTETVVVGGGLEKGADLILEPIRKVARKFVLKDLAERLKIIPSSIKEDAVSLGAASLAVRDIFLKA